MKAFEFWRAVTVDESGFLDRLLHLLESERIHYCVIGGQGVNAYVEPLVSLDLDLVIAADDLERLMPRLGYDFDVERFAHSLNLTARDSELRVQFQLDPRYAEFVPRAETRMVLGRELPVALVQDLLAGKVWAVTDPTRRPSKRQKDLADIARLLERYPALEPRIPDAVRDKLSWP